MKYIECLTHEAHHEHQHFQHIGKCPSVDSADLNQKKRKNHGQEAHRNVSKENPAMAFHNNKHIIKQIHNRKEPASQNNIQKSGLIWRQLHIGDRPQHRHADRPGTGQCDDCQDQYNGHQPL